MLETRRRHYQAIVIGISAGGMGTLKALLGALPKDFPLPILIAQHLSPDSGDAMALFLDQLCAIHVKEADEEERPTGGRVYLAPANYHLMVEPDGRLGLSADPPVNFSRPSADVLFETAAEAFGEGLIGVVLTGAGIDGSRLVPLEQMVVLIHAGGDEYNRKLPRLGTFTHQFSGLETIHFRHLDVQQYQGEIPVQGLPKRFIARPGLHQIQPHVV